MNAPSADPERWSNRRWWTTVIVVLVVQLVLIFTFSDRQPLRRRVPNRAPEMHLFGSSDRALLELMDPTLYALPHPQGFSGPAWLQITVPQSDFRLADWSEAPRWLTNVTGLGGTFDVFLRTNRQFALARPAEPIPALTMPTTHPPPGIPTATTVQLQGELREQDLLSALQPGVRPYTDLLTNTVVQAVVDAKGRPISVTLLASSSDPVADAQALEQSRTARFAALPEAWEKVNPTPAELRWVSLVFQWHGVTAPGTNAPTAP